MHGRVCKVKGDPGRGLIYLRLVLTQPLKNIKRHASTHTQHNDGLFGVE